MMDLPAGTMAASEASHQPCPYVGARPFEDRDKAFFFGRRRDAGNLSNIVAACTLTIVYGPSGAGKSSLLNTRLVDGLERVEQDWIPIWFSSWQPGFEAALLQDAQRAIGEQGESVSPDFRMPQFAAGLLGLTRETGRPIVLVLDQFEEYFLYNGTGAAGFETALARLCNRRNSPVRIVLSLRSDRLFLLDRLRSRIPDILQNLFLVDPLDKAGACEAVVGPLAVYAEQEGTTAAVSDEVVDAIVNGADDREIFQRLPLRGRGFARPAESASKPKLRIVAPFLQLALETLWNQDIVARKGSVMTLSGLYELANAPPEALPTSLVGRIAQRHLDTLLERFSDEEQTVCANLFDRMVTHAGSKVAVTVPYDFSAMLDQTQLEMARSLLDTLAKPGPSRLVRRVASEDALPVAETGTDAPARFEIVHDALAVSILDWVSRRRDLQGRRAAAKREREAALKLVEEAQAREAAERVQRQQAEASARRKIATVAAALGLACVLFLAVGAYLNFNDRKTAIERFNAFAERDSSPEFRLRLLLPVASLSLASGPWSLLLNRNAATESLKHSLASAPRWGESGLAVGLDEGGKKLVVLTRDHELKERVLLPGAQLSPQPLPSVTEFFKSDHPSPLQPGWQPYAVGYVRGLERPVLIESGILHYLPNDSGSDWQSVELAKLAGDFIRLPGFVRVEVAAGAVQLTVSNFGREQRVLRLRPDVADDGKPVFSPIASIPPDIQGQGRRYPPALSPWMNAEPHDRFAFRETNPTTAGQLVAARALKVGSISMSAPVQVLGTKDAETNEEVQENPETQASLAFSDDQSALAVRTGSKVSIIPLDPFSGPGLTLTAPRDAVSEVVSSFPGRPLFAVVHLNGLEYRVAWLSKRGIVLLGSKDGGSLNEDRTLFVGHGDGFRLNFSPDGNRLIFVGLMRSLGGPPRGQQALVWDLTRQWQDQVRELDQPTLIANACDEAKIEDAEHPGLSQDEWITWQTPNGVRPCLG